MLPASPVTLKPGSVVYLKGAANCSATTINGGAPGSAHGEFTISGTAADPIILKQYPGATADLVVNDVNDVEWRHAIQHCTGVQPRGRFGSSQDLRT